MELDHTDYISLLKNAVGEESFVLLTFSKKSRANDSPWVKVRVRPVLIKDKKMFQFSYFDPKRDITKNYSQDELDERLDEMFAISFGHITLKTTSGTTYVRISRTGQVTIGQDKLAEPLEAPDLSHDRLKDQPLAPGTADEFLARIGVTDAQGKVRPSMSGKHAQINEFLRIIDQVIKEDVTAETQVRPLRVVDCGCGSAHLTFAAYHYLAKVRGLPVNMTGVDVNAELIAGNRISAADLGLDKIEFVESTIAEYQPSETPDVVMSLHACDTATDEAIARGVIWRSRAILAAPCCQHELNDKIKSDVFHAVLRHGIFKERIADILTDSFRALILRIMGYRVTVMEFVDPEHTAKNLMIRAEGGGKVGNSAAISEYVKLKEFWGVTPVIEEMLGDNLKRYMG